MLKEKIKAEMTAAFKAKDLVARGTLALLLSAIQNRELEKRTRLMKAGATSEAEVSEKALLTDEEILDAIGSEVKKRKDSIGQYEAAGRAELAASEAREVAVLMRYLPEPMSEAEVKQLISQAIAATGATGAKEMGKVMGPVSAKTKGRFDGGRVSQLVKEALG